MQNGQKMHTHMGAFCVRKWDATSHFWDPFGGVYVALFGCGLDSADLHLYSCSLKMGNVSVEATVTSIFANSDVICFVYPWPGSRGLTEVILGYNGSNIDTDVGGVFLSIQGEVL